jgi:hypothetical protein
MIKGILGAVLKIKHNVQSQYLKKKKIKLRCQQRTVDCRAWVNWVSYLKFFKDYMKELPGSIFVFQLPMCLRNKIIIPVRNHVEVRMYRKDNLNSSKLIINLQQK